MKNQIVSPPYVRFKNAKYGAYASSQTYKYRMLLEYFVITECTILS